MNLVLEYIEGISLLEFLRQKSMKVTDCSKREAMLRPIMTQLLEAIYCLHSKNLVHRDVKLENVIVKKDGQSCTLLDFGFSFCTDEAQVKEGKKT